MRTLISSLVFLVGVSSVALADTPAKTAKRAHPAKAMKPLKVTSTAFKANADIPTVYTCEGSELAPPLSWTKAPAGTQSFALVAEDIDAPGGKFLHWMVTGIPATTTSLAGGGALPTGAQVSQNDKGAPGYAGPCPPQGRHHYVFHIYALDIPLGESMTRADFDQAIAGHVLAQGKLVGTYKKDGKNEGKSEGADKAKDTGTMKNTAPNSAPSATPHAAPPSDTSATPSPSPSPGSMQPKDEDKGKSPDKASPYPPQP